MKNNLLLVLAFILALALCSCRKTTAITFTVGELTFETTSPTELMLVKADTSVAHLRLDSTFTYEEHTYKLTSIGDRAFEGCTALKSITIPNSVTSIGYGAFLGCDNLIFPVHNAHCFAYMPQSYDGHYTIPSGIKQIASHSFYGCFLLTSITIPSSVTSIDDEAFCMCTGLTELTIPSSVTSIGKAAFWGCDALSAITIPRNVTSIGEGAFGFCQGLTSIVVETGNPKYDSRDHCNALIETASQTLLAGCPSTIIPDSVRTIGYEAFAGCDALTSIALPSSVTSIGDYAFYDCRRLRSVTIPAGVTSIGAGAFKDCQGLSSVMLPDGVTTVGNEAFWGCSGLTELTIPASLKHIGDYAFCYCIGLSAVTIPSHTEVADNAFPPRTKIIRK